MVADGLCGSGSTNRGWSVPILELLSMRWDVRLDLIKCVDESNIGLVPAVQERMALGERFAVNRPLLRV